MIKELSIISELRNLRTQKSILSEKERELSSHILTDYSLIGEIYGLFNDILKESVCSPIPDSPMQRKKFLFIILFLYSPRTLAGGKMHSGMRKALEVIYPNIKPNTISGYVSDIVFLYSQYKSYRKEIDGLYAKIIEKLKDEGKI